jgi:hypothetical protein
VRQISAETWRQQFLYPRQQRHGAQAKEYANELARRVIAWSQARRPTSLRADAAEAILIGLWGALEVGWLDQPPLDCGVYRPQTSGVGSLPQIGYTGGRHSPHSNEDTTRSTEEHA